MQERLSIVFNYPTAKRSKCIYAFAFPAGIYWLSNWDLRNYIMKLQDASRQKLIYQNP